jgi:hypothetical protein
MAAISGVVTAFSVSRRPSTATGWDLLLRLDWTAGDELAEEARRLEAHRLASVMYGAAGGPGGPNGGPTPPSGEDGAPPGDKKGGKDGGVIDAEFEETGG